MFFVEKVGPYDVIQPLAAGGMAEVYLARKTGPGGFEKRLVIKRITKKLLGDREVETMFRDEARVQALLNHPNIVQIYDFGEEGGAYYIAMEYVQGATLRWVIDNAVATGKPLPAQHALRIASDILCGLEYAHKLRDLDGKPLGLVHRDISPVNVLVARSGTAKLCDFGVAKSKLQSLLTQVGIVKGKFRYMAPEQLNSIPLDGRADVFAVGICLWEMLVGRRLFDQKSDAEIVAAIRSGDYPSPSQYRDIPRALDRLVMKALSLDLDRRFRSARSFQIACEDLLRLLPKTSNSALLADYLDAQLEFAASERPRDRTEVLEREKLAESGYEALDPPIPTGVGPAVDSVDEATDALPPPTGLGRAASVALMMPAGAFAGVAKTVSAVGSVLNRRRDSEPGVKVTRSSSSD